MDSAAVDSFEQTVGELRSAENRFEEMEYVYGSWRIARGRRVAVPVCRRWRDLPQSLSTTDTRTQVPHRHRAGDLDCDVVTSDVECCGMAGGLGYKTECYELSVDIGEDTQEQFEADDATNRRVVVSGTSCLERLDQMLSWPTQHPVQLVDPDR